MRLNRLGGWWSQHSPWAMAVVLLVMALIPRVWGLKQVISVDEQLWLERTTAFWSGLTGGDIAATYQSPHPGVTTMWLGGLGLLWLWSGQGSLEQVAATAPYWSVLTAMRWPLVLVSSVGVVGIYGLLKRLSSSAVAFTAGLLLALDPFSVAHARVLHQDGLFTLFITLSLLSWLVFLVTEQRWQWLWVSGVTAGLAVLSKLTGVVLGIGLPLITLVYLSRQRALKPVWWQWGQWLVVWGLAVALTVGLLWPALWVMPQTIWRNCLVFVLEAGGEAHERGVFFWGQVDPDGSWLFYLINLAFRLSLGTTLGVGLTIWAAGRRQLTGGKVLGLSGLFGLLFLFIITVGGKKQDRYMLPLFPLLTWLAASGWVWGWSWLRRWPILFKGGPILFILALIVSLVPYFPYYFSYYNPLLGGGAAASRVIMVGRGEGLEAAAEYLNSLPQADQMQVASWYGTTFRPLFVGKTVDAVHLSNYVASNYVVLYINQWQRHLPDDTTLAYLAAQTPAQTISKNGIAYAHIFRAPGANHSLDSEPRLVGQAQLLAFSQEQERLSLYWLGLGKSTATEFRASLVDGAGVTWGWGYWIKDEALMPVSDQAIWRTDFNLQIFPGTPPGVYNLNVWLERLATSEIIGQFPLTAAEAEVTVPRRPILPRVEEFNINALRPAAFQPLHLLGYNWAGKIWLPGESRSLELFWQLPLETLPPANISTVATLTLRPYAPLASVHAVNWERPVTPAYPTSQWQPGDIFRDVWQLNLPPYIPPGQYDIALTLNHITHSIGQIEIGGRPRVFALPTAIQHPLALKLGESIGLRGYDLSRQAAQLHLTLYWQAENVLFQDYTVFVQVIDANGKIRAQQDQLPLAGNAPPSTWAAGEVLIDTYTLSLPPTFDGAPYKLIAGLYRADTGERLTVWQQGQALGDYVNLGILEKE